MTDAKKFVQTVMYSGKPYESCIETRIRIYENLKTKSSPAVPADPKSLEEEMHRFNLTSFVWLCCLDAAVLRPDPRAHGWKHDETVKCLTPQWFTGKQLPPSLTKPEKSCKRKKKVFCQANESEADAEDEKRDEENLVPLAKRSRQATRRHHLEQPPGEAGYSADSEAQSNAGVESILAEYIEDEEESETDVEVEAQPAPVVSAKKKKAPKETASKKKKATLKFEWPDHLVEALINEWQQQDIRYDVSHPQYHMKDKRRIAIQRIITVFEIQEVSPLPSGAGANEVYKSRWQFYESLQFLADNVLPRRTESNITKRNADTPIEEEENEIYAYPVNNKPSAKSAKKTEALKIDQLLETAITALRQPTVKPSDNSERTADKIFGEMVWKMLREIPDCYAKDIVKMDIQRPLIQAKHSRQPTVQPTVQQQHFPNSQQIADFDFRATPPLQGNQRGDMNVRRNFSFSSECENIDQS
eukprot:gene3862-4399_t